ncbi:hypothetical protein HYDPIDRAFT_32921 [Hydnomerulius pinastri MD-312]|uniref:HSF-type DNA-binding domain-containing protein n=1 Tax=Hydnomerulius pinastri MD-312 TaxID=994086 RepID=A0A0C9V345_9AGAM|nr:hypothetical protein HYDPIDRAFT_32921 [Hydnomerulius pinastri MD-312]
MATDQQMSLTVAPRGGSSHLNKPARQLVPAFLQKLYEMVNDPADHDLIRWSDTGDSFFVLDQERFASEVLGRWFKHKNFSSFVRQLNMYGFHKIPHLQQGVLRSDSDTEFWNFEHPHFLRGQPDMLCLIQRKKQAPTTGEDTHASPAASKDAAGNSAVGTLSAGQLLDINSIVNGIQAIKRHQAAISSDLNELKSSNQHLWQEAMAAREKHKKHQDTINRILKFLAGVFGHGESQMRKDEDGHGTSHAVVPRKPQRLMIGDGRGGKKGVEITEVTEDGPRSSMESAQSTGSMSAFRLAAHCPNADSQFLPDYFGSADTPPTAPSETFTSPRFASIEPSVTDVPTPTSSETRPLSQDTQPFNPTPSNSTSTSLTTTTPPPQTTNDTMVQAALTQVLNSPSQMQKLLAALASQSISPEVFPPPAQNEQQLLAPYDPSHYNNMVNAGLEMPIDNTRVPATYDFSAAANAPSPFSLSLLGGPPEGDQLVPFENHDERLQKTYRSAAEITNDVDELQSNIQSLIQSLGIDPTSLDTSLPQPVDGVGGDGGGTGGADMFPSVGGQDFDFDSFLMDMPRASEDDGDLDRLAERLDPAVVASSETSSKLPNASSEQLHAFLDEVASQDGNDLGPPAHGQLHGSSILNMASNSGSVGGQARGRKRKSDVISDAGNTYSNQQQQATTTSSSSITGTKSKRKR